MNQNRSERYRVVEIGLIAIAAVYLFIEIALNAALLDAVSDGLLAAQLEGAGRTVSAFGAALITFRFLYLSKLDFNVVQSLGVGLIVAIFIYWGQARIVEYFVDNATPVEVKAAQHLALLQSAQISGVAGLAGVSDEIRNDYPSNRAFASMMAFTSWGNPSHLGVVRDAAPRIVEYEVRSRMNGRLEDAYQRYKNYVEVELPGLYKRFVETIDDNEERISTAIQANYPNFMEWWEGAEKCRSAQASSTCFEDRMAKVDQKLIGIFGADISWRDICDEVTEVRKRNVNGRSTYHRITTNSCSGFTPGMFDTRIREQLGLPTEKGVEVSWVQFINSDIVQSGFREQMGVDSLGENAFNLSFNEFIESVGEHLIEAEFNRQMRLFETPSQSLDNEGRDYVRAIIILPVAIVLSIAFSMLNVLGILISISGLIGLRYFSYVTATASVAALSVMSTPNGVIAGFSGWLMDSVIYLESIAYPIGSTASILFK